MKFDDYRVGMRLRLKGSLKFATVSKFVWDDFSSGENFCDRIECNWYTSDGIKVTEEFAFNEVEFQNQIT